MGGYSIGTIEFYPLQYEPETGRLLLYQRIDYELNLKGEDSGNVKPKIRSVRAEEHWRDLIKKMVDNPEEVGYSGARLIDTTLTTPDIPNIVEYLIIVGNSSLESTAQTLADWKTRMGHKAEVLTTDWIESNYSGVDDMEKYRECIKDYYQNKGLVYVLLIGSINGIGCRDGYDYGFDVSEGDHKVPTELYYACLDRDWNADGDDRWGEYPSDNPDVGYEVFLGRLNVNNSAGLEDEIDKIFIYEGSSSASVNNPFNYEDDALFMAGYLDSWTDCSLVKDRIDSWYYPSWWDITKLYEDDWNMSRTNCLNSLEDGQNVVNHIHHCNTTVLGTQGSGISSNDLYNLENSPKFSGTFYTIGCYACNIDYNNNCGSMFMLAPDGGGVGFVGNTRYGWYSPGNPYGVSNAFDIDYHECLIDDGITIAGEVQAAHKQGWGIADDYYRYIIYELYLQGDPALDIWTGDISADNLAVDHPSSVGSGNQSITVSVDMGGSPLEDALVCLWQEGHEYVYGETDSSGEIQFNVSLDGSPDVLVTVSAHNADTYEGEIEISGSPVELVEFRGEYIEEGVELSWNVVSYGEDITGYNLYRKKEDFFDKNNSTELFETHFSPFSSNTGDWAKVNDTIITGENPYHYIDYGAVEGDGYTYKLEAVIKEANEVLGTTVPTGGIPTSFELSGIYPNPAVDNMNVVYTLAENSDVKIEIYDITGRKLKTVDAGSVMAGENSELVDVLGLNNGMYILRLVAGENTNTGKFVVVK
jgi:hypothetical protein